jgi:hypothetical protein
MVRYSNIILVNRMIKNLATLSNCGKVLRASITTLVWKHSRGSLLTTGSVGNKIEDWKIRSQDPKFYENKIWIRFRD